MAKKYILAFTNINGCCVSVDDIEFDWNLLFPVWFSVFIYVVWLRDYIHSWTDNQGVINGIQFMIQN